MFDHWMWGMHAGWWIVAIVIIVAAIALLTRTSEPRNSSESPLEVLQRRYAAGEISTEEYDERKAQLDDTLS